MNGSAQFTSLLAELHALARFQRSVRLGLRALWLFAAGILAGWAIDRLWSVMPGWTSWVLLGIAFAILPLVELAFSLSSRSKWVWTLDQRLGLDEQVSTAWTVIHSEKPGMLSEALVADVIGILPNIRERMMKRGWFLERELVSASIIMLLAAMVLTTALIRSYQGEIQRSPISMEQMPSLSEDPKMEEVFPQGPLGIQRAPQNGGVSQSNEGSSPSDQGSQPGDQPGNTNQGMGSLEDVLGKMGDQLSGQAPTFDLGQALKEMDLEGAAEELEKLGEQMDGLSPETKQGLGQAMQDAANELQGTEQQDLAQDLSEAADALQENAETGNGEGQARQEMNDLAQQLRELPGGQQNGELAGGGSGTGVSGSTGQAESTDRLQGEGEDFNLEVNDPSQSGLLNPAPPDAAGSGTASGSLDSAAQSSDDVIQSVIVPNSFLWKWRDVVSSYFQH